MGALTGRPPTFGRLTHGPRRSVSLEPARLEPRSVHLDADRRGMQERLGWVVEVDPRDLTHLLPVARRLSTLASQREPDAEVVGDVAVGIRDEMVVLP